MRAFVFWEGDLGRKKNVFVSGPITRMLRHLCPGCKFQVDKTEKKKKKKVDETAHSCCALS